LIILPPTVADNLYFNGSSYVRWDLLRHPISASRETIRFRFKTNYADGAILYGRGSQGDYFALQMRDNRMLLNIDLGNSIIIIEIIIQCMKQFLPTSIILLDGKFAGFVLSRFAQVYNKKTAMPNNFSMFPNFEK
jgi:carbohydrate-binding DOMON domain-containing protein